MVDFIGYIYGIYPKISEIKGGGVGYGGRTGQEKISAIIKMLTYLGISKKSVTTISD